MLHNCATLPPYIWKAEAEAPKAHSNNKLMVCPPLLVEAITGNPLKEGGETVPANKLLKVYFGKVIPKTTLLLSVQGAGIAEHCTISHQTIIPGPITRSCLGEEQELMVVIQTIKSVKMEDLLNIRLLIAGLE
jgi:hypothetical protein